MLEGMIEESIDAGIDSMFDEDTSDIRRMAMDVAYAALQYFLEHGAIKKVIQVVPKTASATLVIQD